MRMQGRIGLGFGRHEQQREESIPHQPRLILRGTRSLSHSLLVGRQRENNNSYQDPEQERITVPHVPKLPLSASTSTSQLTAPTLTAAESTVALPIIRSDNSETDDLQAQKQQSLQQLLQNQNLYHPPADRIEALKRIVSTGALPNRYQLLGSIGSTTFVSDYEVICRMMPGIKVPRPSDPDPLNPNFGIVYSNRDAKDARVRVIYLHRNMLTGSIPESIGNLTELVKLNLGHNRFEGELPDSIGQLKNLRSFVVQVNKLTGEIPRAIQKLRNLEAFHMESNQLIGFIPSSVYRLASLKAAFNSEPQKTGPAPFEILPQYLETHAAASHPNHDILSQLEGNGASTSRSPTSIYDLPDEPTVWTPQDVAFWIQTYSGNSASPACEAVTAIGLGGDAFFRLTEDSLENVLGIQDAGVRMLLAVGMQKVLDVARGILPPEYDMN
ncbi:hypothetical protein HK100_005641 [Physocladia obscura]|uniref:SAM domain-containing protein n=1 Tax=Physocladia obscura TaxID=109957 RepID=A0AAD5SRC9_9FUNG|nr:hypothetical protein HK100_005641 [Physocladia obscura]